MGVCLSALSTLSPAGLDSGIFKEEAGKKAPGAR